MYRSFQTMMTIHNPSVIFFLGELVVILQYTIIITKNDEGKQPVIVLCTLIKCNYGHNIASLKAGMHSLMAVSVLVIRLSPR